MEDRDRVRESLQSRGVQTAIQYPRPVHLQKPYAVLGYGLGSLPHTEHACASCLSLPLFPEMTLDPVRYVVEALTEAVEETNAVALAR